MWIVVNAIWIYNMLERSGYFAVIKRSFGRLSEDQRVQAVLIAFCFGALLEALAGFGTPVAICSVMLIGLGFQPAKAAAVALVANTAPVAFGAIAVPITTLAPLANLPKDDLGAMVGRQTPFLALVVPLILVGMVDGRRGIKAAWPAAVVGGLAFAVGQFAVLELPLGRAGRHRRLAGWRPARSSRCCSSGSPASRRRARRRRAPGDGRRRERRRPAALREGGAPARRRRARRHLKRDTPGEIITAFSPYLILIAVFALAQIHWLPFFDWLDARTKAFDWPGLDILNAKGKAPTAVTFKFNWANAAGTLLLICGLLSMITLRVNARRALAAYVATLNQLKFAILTVATVLALAYVMNLSGQTITIGNWLAGAGAAFALLSPILGWLGRRGHRLGHVVQRALRRAAGVGRPEGQPLAHADGRRELERRRAGQDDLAPEPRHRRGRRRHGWPGRRPVP